MDSLHTTCISIDCGLLFVPICAKTRELIYLPYGWSGVGTPVAACSRRRERKVYHQECLSRDPLSGLKVAYTEDVTTRWRFVTFIILHFSRLHLLSGFGRALAPDLQNRNFVYRTELYTSLQCSPGIHT